MKIGITGASGFIGSKVIELAVARGHTVVGYSRRPTAPINNCTEVRRFVAGTALDCTGLDAMIHLAGESVLGVWTEAKRQAIRDSRILGTRSVVEGIQATNNKPALISASAIGYYGDTGDQLVDESCPAGEGFLADVSKDWESEALLAEDFSSRVVILRIGFVVAADGGAMDKLKPVFRFGLGGNLGSGRQWMSLIHVDDVAGMALWAAENSVASGAYNCVLPEPIQNANFTRTIAELLKRPAFMHVPSFVIRSLAGDLSTLFLDSHRIIPSAATKVGYQFQYANNLDALRECINSKP